MSGPEVRYITECPYCAAGPFRQVYVHTLAVHGKKAADMCRDFGWTRARVRFNSPERAALSRHDAFARVHDGEFFPAQGNPARYRRWAAAARVERAAGRGWSSRLAARWRVSQSAAVQRVRATTAAGYDIGPINDCCAFGHSAQWIYPSRARPTSRTCGECRRSYQKEWARQRRAAAGH